MPISGIVIQVQRGFCMCEEKSSCWHSQAIPAVCSRLWRHTDQNKQIKMILYEAAGALKTYLSIIELMGWHPFCWDITLRPLYPFLGGTAIDFDGSRFSCFAPLSSWALTAEVLIRYSHLNVNLKAVFFFWGTVCIQWAAPNAIFFSVFYSNPKCWFHTFESSERLLEKIRHSEYACTIE